MSGKNNVDIPTHEQPTAGRRRSREEWEELALIYHRAENAAVKIQQKFRNNRNQQQSAKSSNSSSSNTSDTEKDNDESTVLHANGDDNGSNTGSDAGENNNLFTLIFLALITLLTSVRGYVEKIANWMSQCLACLAKCCRGGNGGLGNATQQSSKGISTR